MVFLSAILLAVIAVGLLVGAVVSKRHRRLLVVIAVALLAYAVWRTITSAGFLGGLFFVAGSIAVIGGVVYWAVHFLDRMRRREKSGPARLDSAAQGVLGKIGVAVTPLRPTGTAEIEGSRVPVSTEGEFIAQGSYVRVVAKARKRYFVRLAEPSELVEAVGRSAT